MRSNLREVVCRWPLTLHHRRPHQWLPKRTKHFLVAKNLGRILLTAIPFKGIAATAGYVVVPGCDTLPPATWCMEFPSMAIKKRESRAKDIKHLAPVESNIFSGLLSLVEHMCLMQYEDGSPRVPGWLTVKSQGAAWAVQVKDPDSCSSFTAVGATLDNAIETAALLLSCDDAPWEADKWLADAAMRAKKK